ncbi:hypothetical protein M1M13_gp188 [Synechococcus phage ACG-2014j]|uniref:C1q domain-containing protein n=1 Tax=Synechococcus phage ACG-2014j TaxID=1493514 RepID=A0A0E3HLK5_9CAUD|nr:hypothetical protein M1M13_gp188 [Synechococcus phage ACG-2014j]AIX28532.1 hypothetical protein Syn7803US23_188 [Synechococcus phage ACG-2014j]
MAIVFPASPTLNDTFTEGSITYKCVQVNPNKWIGLGVTPADRLVEGSNKLEIDGSNNLVWAGNNVGIGIDNPSGNLHVGSGSGQAPANSAKNIVIDGSGAVGMGILFGTSANTAYGNIYWGNSTDGSADGRITYFGSTYATAGDRQAMVFRTAGSEKLRITSDGHLKIPYQPRFLAYGTSSSPQTTSGSFTWDTFTTTRFNVGGHFSTTTKVFTAPTAGCYAFGSNCRIDSGDIGYFRLILSVNGSSDDNQQGHSIRNTDTGSAAFHSQSVTALYELNAGDTVKVLVEANSDSSWVMQSESQFWGYLVG